MGSPFSQSSRTGVFTEEDENTFHTCVPAARQLFLGELYAHGGQKEKALENLKKAETMFLEMGMDYWLDETREVSAGL